LLQPDGRKKEATIYQVSSLKTIDSAGKSDAYKNRTAAGDIFFTE